MKIYIDGVVVASTANNEASYVAMESGSGNLEIGGVLGGVNLWQGDYGMTFFEKSELTAAQVWKLYIKTRGYYNL